MKSIFDCYLAIRWLPAGRLALLIAAASLILAGCSEPTLQHKGRGSAARQAHSEYLRQAVEFVSRLDEFDRQQAVTQATFNLNRWMDTQEELPQWQADPLVRTLPRAIRDAEIMQTLGSRQFRLEDAETLMQAVWMRDLSRWIASQPVAGPLGEVVEQQLARLSGDDGDTLTIAYRLFDWTIRSIQLEELLPYPADPVSGPGLGGDRQQPLQPPPLRAIPGPGYALHPWQATLYGHGDALMRARAFIQLARQQGIDVLVLGFPGQTTPPRPLPWVAAVLTGDQLYLFDPQLGLPIPDASGKGVATLAEVLDNPGLLKALDAGDDLKYTVTAADLRRVLALIDAAPSAISQRMQMVEAALSGEHRLVLTLSPSQIAERLARCRGVQESQLWSVPYEAIWFREAVQTRRRESMQFAAQYMMQHGLFETRNSLVQARFRHFRGDFDNRGEELGAKLLYLESRVPEKQLEGLANSPELQAHFGLARDEQENNELWRARIAAARSMMEQTKLMSSYCLGLAHHDSGKYNAAIEWLHGRTLQATPESPWRNGASYNLARAHEALGQVQQARELYLADKSPQLHGNLLRARLLRLLAS